MIFCKMHSKYAETERQQKNHIRQIRIRIMVNQELGSQLYLDII